MNRWVGTGNVASDIELRQTASGTSVCSFRIAVQRKYKNPQGERESDFFSVVVFDQRADYCYKYMQKGTRCAIEGILRSRNYTAQDGSKRNVVEIVVDSVEIVARGREYSTSTTAQQDTHETNGGFEEVDEELPFV